MEFGYILIKAVTEYIAETVCSQGAGCLFEGEAVGLFQCIIRKILCKNQQI